MWSLLVELGFKDIVQSQYANVQYTKNVKVEFPLLVLMFNILEIIPLSSSILLKSWRVPVFLYNCVFCNTFLICKEMKLFLNDDDRFKNHAED